MRPRLWLVRHSETDWSASGKHTGRTDVPLNEAGRAQAKSLGHGIAALDVHFSDAYTSPLSRAHETATLAGFAGAVRLDDLCEWDYGEFEGRKTADVRRDLDDPEWVIWTTPIHKGEVPADVGNRADRVRERLSQEDGDILVFAHGHFLRIFAARWMGLAAVAGQHLALDTGTVSILAYEHECRVIERWNALLGER